MEDKDAEVERLKTELIDQKEEQEEPGKDSEELEETKEANHDLKTRLEEAKRIKEYLEESCYHIYSS